MCLFWHQWLHLRSPLLVIARALIFALQCQCPADWGKELLYVQGFFFLLSCKARRVKKLAATNASAAAITFQKVALCKSFYHEKSL